MKGKAVLVRDGDERIRPRQQFLAGASRPIELAGSGQRSSQAERMTVFVPLLDRRLALETRLIEVAKVRQVNREIIEQVDQGVRDVERPVEGAVPGIE